MSRLVECETRLSSNSKCKLGVVQNEPHDDDNEQQFEGNNENITGESYECPYCNHIFKSHYCYQKHKRRHINPFTPDFCANIDRLDQVHLQTLQEGPSSVNVFSCIKEDNTIKGRGIRDNGGGKANILRDINVQFFPCKIMENFP